MAESTGGEVMLAPNVAQEVATEILTLVHGLGDDLARHDHAPGLTVADFGKVDADAHPELAKRYGVRGLPTLLLLKGAVEVGRSFSVTKTRLAAMIESNLG